VSSDEREIFQFLKTWGVTFVGANEVCRRAGSKKKFHEDPHWAKPLLMNMVDRGILESDVSGRFRVKALPRKDKSKRWVAPEIAKILEGKGIQVEGSEEGGAAAPDEYYDQL
jgi:hypothetical protein